MEKLEVTNIGVKGLNSDLAAWELSPEYITFGYNFRASGDALEATRAYEPWASPPTPFNAGHLLSVEISGGDYWLVPGRDAVWQYDGGAWTDVSSVEGYLGLGINDELRWTSCMLGSIPVINNPQEFPEYWSPVGSGQKLQRLNFSPGVSWESAAKSFEVIRSHNNFLFALNLTEGGKSLPNSYRWSHPADTNGLPFTWDETDPSSIASIEQILGDAGGIVDGLTLRNSFCIYSERGINLLEQTNDEFVFRNRELSSTYGLLNRNSLVEVNGVHYFISDGDILVNDGNSIRSIVYNRIRKQFNSNINGDFFERSFAVLNKVEKEIWFCVPGTSSEFPDTAYVYNWAGDSWTVKHLPDNVAFAAYGRVSVPPITWSSLTGSWSSQASTYDTQAASPLSRTVMAVDNTNGDLVIINPLISTAVAVDSLIERTDFPLMGMDVVTTITRIYPHMDGTSPVSIEVGSQQFPGAPVSWKPPYTFNPSLDRKIDVRTTGELHAWRIKSIGTGTWSLSGLTIEYSFAGKR